MRGWLFGRQRWLRIGSGRFPQYEFRCRISRSIELNEAACRKAAVEESAVVEGVVDNPIGSARLARRILRQHEQPAAARSSGQRLALAIEKGTRRAELERQRDVTPPLGKIAACGERHELGVAIAFGRRAGLSPQSQSLEIAPGDEIHDACHGVGSVDRRVATRHDIDPLDQVGRNRVDVDEIVAGRRCHVAAVVHQDQRSLDAETPQVEPVQAGGADETRRVGLAKGRPECWQVVERIAEADVALIVEFLCRDGNDRYRRGLAFDTPDARSRDDDFSQVGLLPRYRLRLGTPGRNNGQNCQDLRDQRATPQAMH